MGGTGLLLLMLVVGGEAAGAGREETRGGRGEGGLRALYKRWENRRVRIQGAGKGEEQRERKREEEREKKQEELLGLGEVTINRESKEEVFTEDRPVREERGREDDKSDGKNVPSIMEVFGGERGEAQAMSKTGNGVEESAEQSEVTEVVEDNPTGDVREVRKVVSESVESEDDHETVVYIVSGADQRTVVARLDSKEERRKYFAARKKAGGGKQEREGQNAVVLGMKSNPEPFAHFPSVGQQTPKEITTTSPPAETTIHPQTTARPRRSFQRAAKWLRKRHPEPASSSPGSSSSNKFGSRSSARSRASFSSSSTSSSSSSSMPRSGSSLRSHPSSKSISRSRSTSESVVPSAVQTEGRWTRKVETVVEESPVSPEAWLDRFYSSSIQPKKQGAAQKSPLPIMSKKVKTGSSSSLSLSKPAAHPAHTDTLLGLVALVNSEETTSLRPEPKAQLNLTSPSNNSSSSPIVLSATMPTAAPLQITTSSIADLRPRDFLLQMMLLSQDSATLPAPETPGTKEEVTKIASSHL